MQVGTGPLGSGTAPRGASSALIRLSTSVMSAGRRVRFFFWMWRISLGSGTSPSPRPQTTSWMVISEATRSCLRRSEARSERTRLGWPSPTSTMPGGPTTRWTTSCCLVKPTAGSTFQPRRSMLSAAAAAPGCPSIWE